MVVMTATKMLTYANRRLVPGEDFEAKSQRDMKVLLASRKAKKKRDPGEAPPPPPEVAKQIVEAISDLQPANPSPSVAGSGNDSNEAGDLVEARADYKRAFDRSAHHTWSAAQIRQKIADAST